MIQLSELTEIYLHRDIVDFKTSINGLMIIVEDEMKLSPFNGALFIFCNRSRDKLKALYWDQTGFCLWYKRLEKDKFKWPRESELSTFELSEQQWNWQLPDLDLSKMKKHLPLKYEVFR